MGLASVPNSSQVLQHVILEPAKMQYFPLGAAAMDSDVRQVAFNLFLVHRQRLRHSVPFLMENKPVRNYSVLHAMGWSSS
jgi:hypothetical protein